MSSLLGPVVLSEKDNELRQSKQEARQFQVCDWNRCLPYLRLLAATGFNQQLKAKLDPSDIVQQTLLQAHRSQALFRGTTEGELMAWLKQILTRNLIHATRDFGSQKRDFGREVSLQDSWLTGDQVLARSGSSPGDHAQKNEDQLRLYAAIAQLPDGQRFAIELHHFLGRPVSQIAEEMERTPVAVAGLLKRGLRTLRWQLNDRTDSTT